MSFRQVVLFSTPLPSGATILFSLRVVDLLPPPKLLDANQNQQVLVRWGGGVGVGRKMDSLLSNHYNYFLISLNSGSYQWSMSYRILIYFVLTAVQTALNI